MSRKCFGDLEPEEEQQLPGSLPVGGGFASQAADAGLNKVTDA